MSNRLKIKSNKKISVFPFVLIALVLVLGFVFFGDGLFEGKDDLVYAFNTLKKILNIESIELTEKISMIAVNLRTKYKNIKPLDSIHLASAISAGCDVFFTNDKQLKQVSELNILYLSDL